MQVKLFTIPVIGGEKLTEELNAFLRARKILQTENLIVQNSQGAFWCFCIKYIEDAKGTYAALDRAKKYTKKHTWYLKLDMRKFFASIPHQVVKTQLRQLFKDPKLLTILDAIIDSYPSKNNRGLPIGNLTSQYFANHYLNGLDHYIKEKLYCKAYVRYMDDLIIWKDDKKQLKNIYGKINFFVENQLLLTLKPEILNQTKKGLPFLGYLLFPYYTRLKQQSKQRFIKKYKAIEQDYYTGKKTAAECQRKILPLIAFTQHADAKKFRSQIIRN